MGERDFEHEGDLSNPEAKRSADRVASRVREIVGDNLSALTENKAFLFWFQRYGYPLITGVVPVNNGSMLASFSGQRELILKMLNEMDEASPGFLSRMLAVRDEYERELRRVAEQEDHK